MSEATAKALPEWHAPRAHAGVVEKTVHLGDTFHLRIEVAHPGDVSVKLPTQTDLGAFTLNGVEHGSTPGRDGLVTEVWTLKLGAYALDAKEVPPVTMDVVTSNGPARLTFPATPVDVKTHVADEAKAKPRELAPPEKVWVDDYTLLEIGGAVIGAVILALVAWRLWRRWRRRRAAIPAPPPVQRPLDVRALEALRALQAEGLVGRGRKREYFFRLSEIVRDYLGERFGFDALECTSSELLARLRDRPTPGLDFEVFREWTELGDLVKFAKHAPEDAACSEALTRAFGFVEQTTAAAAPRDGEGRAA